MNSFCDNSPSRNIDTLSTRSSFKTSIPCEILEQEREIELMCRDLVETSYKLRDSRVLRRQEIAVWACIAILGLMTVIAFYVLYLKTGGR